MKHRCRNRLTVYSALTVIALIVQLLGMPPSVWAGLLDGKMAPPFELKDQGGNTCALSDYQGKPVLLKIGTTWCPSCTGQSKELIKALPRLESLGVAVLEVFVEETSADVTKYREKYHFPEAIRTCLDQDGEVLQGYSVVSIPRVLILDREHRVVMDQYLLSATKIENAFEKMLGEQKQ